MNLVKMQKTLNEIFMKNKYEKLLKNQHKLSRKMRYYFNFIKNLIQKAKSLKITNIGINERYLSTVFPSITIKKVEGLSGYQSEEGILKFRYESENDIDIAIHHNEIEIFVNGISFMEIKFLKWHVEISISPIAVNKYGDISPAIFSYTMATVENAFEKLKNTFSNKNQMN